MSRYGSRTALNLAFVSTALAVALVAALAAPAHRAAAQPFPEKDVPPALRGWVPWALDGARDRTCPVVGEEALCLWPGRVALSLGASGGTFVLEAWAERPIFLPLPGDAKVWPQDVRLDGKAAPVVPRDERPAVYLGAGRHRVEGRLAWSALPDSLFVPPETALLDLVLDGRTVAFPRREENGLLLLRQEGERAGGGEELRVKVFRRLEDGIPLFLETRLLLEVSGKAREVKLSGVRLSGTVPVAVRGELPARLDADGRLVVQVRTGRFTVSVLARLEGRPAAFQRDAAVTAPWPDQEIWVFAANERLRQVELSGGTPIDPSRTDLPAEWQKLPAYQLGPKVELRLAETRRGEVEAAPDQVNVARELWLDLDGRGFTVRDRFTGTLRRTSRLNLLAPGSLGRVNVDGEDQLITVDPSEKLSGVELRRTALQMTAESRLADRPGRLSAVGWGVDTQSLSGTLYLPPGWRLLGASGVDTAPQAWLGKWDLLGFFLVLLVSLAAWKLAGWRWGTVALATLVVCHAEPGAPALVWLSLLGAAALLTVVPQGRLRAVVLGWWGVSALVLVVVALPFAVRQVRQGLYPQTEPSAPPAWAVSGVGGLAAAPQALDEKAGFAVNAPASMPPPAPQEQVAKSNAEPRRKSAELYFQNQLSGVIASSKSSEEAYRQDPHAVIQTGSGVPSWSWSSQPLGWSGPVARDHRVRLILLSPFVNLVLAVFRVLLVGLLALRLLSNPRIGEGLRLRRPLAAAAALVLLFGISRGAVAEEEPAQEGPSANASKAAALDGVPDAGLLEELKTRLTRPAACAPDCVATPDVRLTVKGADVEIAAEVHAAAEAAWPVPGPTSAWVPRSVTVDGQPAFALARRDDGFLHLRLTPGTHQVIVSGPLPPRDSLALQFVDRPRRMRAVADGWQVDGVREDGTTDGSVQLTRKLDALSRGEAGSEGHYEPWLEVTRVFEIGISWKVETVVRRVSPPGTPLVVKVPLLKGMLVTDADHPVKDGEVLLTFGRDEEEARWTSALKPVDGQALTLKAAEGKPWSEVWVLRCGAVWQCSARGDFAPTSRQADGTFSAEYRPWPGESLELGFHKPTGAEGQSLTVDDASLAVSPGVRLLDATLALSVRASRTGPLTITLPAKAELQEVRVGDDVRPIRPDGDKLHLSVGPGAQKVQVTWRQEGGVSFLQRFPRVHVGQPAVNGHLTLQLPDNRWLLFAGGPSWGPAILFWGLLAVVALGAIVLGTLPTSPLKGWEWLLLGFGLAQLHVLAVLAVAGWFLVFAWRERRAGQSAGIHDLLQVLLGLWTIVFLVCLYASVRQGLLLRPDMQVAGNGSSDTILKWYVDRFDGALPGAWVVSLPLWTWRVVMLLWSLWLATRLIAWLKWGWSAYVAGGGWKPLAKPKPKAVRQGAVPPPIPPMPPPPPPVLQTGEGTDP
jgi:hypothetical protein